MASRDARKQMGAAGTADADGPNAHMAAFMANRIMTQTIAYNESLGLVPHETRWRYDSFDLGSREVIQAIVEVRFRDTCSRCG